jgi:hypothetical protein
MKYDPSGTLFSTTLTIPPSPQTGPLAVADLEAVGQLNFVSASFNTVWASSIGGMMAGFPIATPANLDDISSNTVIGDVDGAGKPNIIVSGLQSTGVAGTGALYLEILIYDNHGVLERTLSTAPPGSNSLVALADLDGDGIPEIVTAAGSELYAWKGDGSSMPGFPVSIGAGQYAGPVAVGDIDGDGYPDIAFLSSPSNGTSGQLNAYDRHGVALSGFPRPVLYMSGATTPAIGDLDASGRNDLIVATTPFIGLRDSIFVYDLHGAGPYGPVEWGQYMGDARHQGYYETGKNLSTGAYLATQAHGAGTIASSDSAINCGASCLHLYSKGSAATLTATAASGAAFTQRLGGCAGQANPCKISVSGYTAVSADFQSPISVSVAGSGAVTSTPAGINCPGTCTATFPARSAISLTAKAGAGKAFDGWSGNCSGTATTCNLVINAAEAVGAQFSGSDTLSVAFSGTGTDTVTSSPAGINCGPSCSANFTPGTVVTLTAAFSPTTHIPNWGISGCATNSAQASTCQVTMNANVSMVIDIASNPLLSVTVSGTGHGTVGESWATVSASCTQSCTEPIAIGVPATISAAPSANSTFVGWSGACTGSAPSCTVNPIGNESVTATFNSTPSSGGGGGGDILWKDCFSLAAILLVGLLRRASREG